MLSLKNITLHYGTAEAIRDINIEVSEGIVASIIGANGAGKSSILKAITGLVPLTSGEIWFLGRRIDGMAVHDIVKLGVTLVPEGRRPFTYMSVIANLRLGAFLRRDRASVNSDLDEIFARFPVLYERRNQRAGTLSGGEQQMLAIARALMAKPRVLLMDEPSLGLSPIVITELGNVIKDINEMGITIVLVEQNASLVAKVTNRVYVLETGKIVLEGNLKELMANELIRRAFIGG